jgi:Fic family protein
VGKVLKRHWSSSDLGMRRRDREGCDYEAYVPDPLVGRTFRLDGDVAADVADAELAVARFNTSGMVLANSEALARLLLRAESVASSYLEGLVVGGRRLLRAEQARAAGVRALDVTAEEVLGNIDAMTWAVDELSSTPELTVDSLCEVHRRLLEHVPLMHRHAGVLRTEQNWIGGNGYNPCTASYVPPPPEHVEELLTDLCAFANGDALSAITQAAIVHSQFEAIHPFADGNGRAGRALIHVILRRRGLAPRVLVPISLVLATRSRSYIAGLQAMCYRGSPDSTAAHEGLNEWVGTFAAACTRAVADATAFDQRVANVQEEWREALGPLRSDSAAARLIEVLPGAPVVTAQSASELIGRSFRATNEALRQLEDAKVVKQVTVGRRNRAFEASAIMQVFTGLERQMASPAGDTQASSPERPVPPRPPA